MNHVQKHYISERTHHFQTLLLVSRMVANDGDNTERIDRKQSPPQPKRFWKAKPFVNLGKCVHDGAAKPRGRLLNLWLGLLGRFVLRLGRLLRSRRRFLLLLLRAAFLLCVLVAGIVVAGIVRDRSHRVLDGQQSRCLLDVVLLILRNGIWHRPHRFRLGIRAIGLFGGRGVISARSLFLLFFLRCFTNAGDLIGVQMMHHSWYE